MLLALFIPGRGDFTPLSTFRYEEKVRLEVRKNTLVSVNGTGEQAGAELGQAQP